MNPQFIPVNTLSSVATRLADFENVSRFKFRFQGISQ